MQQVGDDREERRLLPAMLGGSRSEGAADLAVELTLEPDAAGTVPRTNAIWLAMRPNRVGAPTMMPS